MEKKGLLKAFGIWLLLLAGYLTYRYYFPPEQPPADATKPPAQAVVSPEVARALLAPWTLPLVDLDLELTHDSKQIEDFVAKLNEAKKKEAERQAAQLEKDVADWANDALQLGSDTGYKLSVVISRRGAAVRSIRLNEYKAADRATARPTNEPLYIIYDDLDGDLEKQDLAGRLERQSYRLLVDGLPLAWEHLADQDLKDDKGNRTRLVFAATLSGKNVRIVKTFSLAPGDYHIGMELKFESLNGSPSEVAYTLTGPRGVPVEGEVWKTMPFRQIMIGTLNPKGTAKRTLVSGQELRDDAKRQPKDKKIKLPLLTGTPPPESLQSCGIMLQYFATLAVVDGDPNKERYIDKVEPELLGDDPVPQVHGRDWPLNQKFQGRLTANMVSRPIKPTADKSQEQKYLLYAGPTKVTLLHYQAGVAPGIVDRYTSEFHLNMMTDYPWWWGFGYGWTQIVVFCTDKMHWLLVHLSWLCGGHHWAAIILMTVLVRGLLFPISRKQALMSLRMQKMAPEMKKLQEKFKDDKQAMAAAQMELYRKYGVNPFGGCLVMLLQMPVLMGLYYALYESVDLRLASFLWIENLAAPDMLFYWGWFDWPIILKDVLEMVTGAITFGYLPITINLGPYFNILPILSTILLVIQQKFMTPPPADEQQAQQQKMMKYMMILMGYAFYWVAAGLCIYFIISGSWGMLERKLLPKMQHDKPAASAAKPAVTERRQKETVSRNGAPNGFLGKVKDWVTDFLEKAKKK
jgi:YidC/Oxa1 family membrane protein insertase